jgi:hypothetical protein
MEVMIDTGRRRADESQHSVSFQPKAMIGWYCSDPVRIEFQTPDAGLPRFDDLSGDTVSLEHQAATELEMIEDLLNQRRLYYLHSTDPEYYRSLGVVEKLVYLCRHFLDLHPLFRSVRAAS